MTAIDMLDDDDRWDFPLCNVEGCDGVAIYAGLCLYHVFDRDEQ